MSKTKAQLELFALRKAIRGLYAKLVDLLEDDGEEEQDHLAEIVVDLRRIIAKDFGGTLPKSHKKVILVPRDRMPTAQRLDVLINDLQNLQYRKVNRRELRSALIAVADLIQDRYTSSQVRDPDPRRTGRP